MKLWRRGFWLVVLILTFGAILLAIRRPILRSAGWALVAEDAVEPADVIVVPEWTGSAGALEAADLVRGRTASRVAVLVDSPSPAQIELIRRGILRGDDRWIVHLLKTLGVDAIEEIPTSASGTTAEGQVVLDWCTQRGFQSVLVVSTSDHTRRLRRVFNRTMHNTTTKVIVRASRYSTFVPDQWWQTRDGTRIEVEELGKLLLDVVRYPVS